MITYNNMILEYMENEKYFLLNNIIKIDLNDSIIIGRLKKINDEVFIYDPKIGRYISTEKYNKLTQSKGTK